MLIHDLVATKLRREVFLNLDKISLAATMDKKQFNFNVGVLGHVDSGKTSLCKALSSVASTACFDKHPQSKERGITLDLGFSSFSIDLDDKRKESLGGHDVVQYTLVDCPGHASLIRTIIGGAQIIDLMFLVVDVVKGMQTQTAECLVIGEILCHKMIVVLNKLDLIPAEKRAAVTEKMKKRILKTLENTRFKNSPVIAVSANSGGQEGSTSNTEGIADLISQLMEETYLPMRTSDGPFIFAVDHCFSIRGQGTVMTGTALNGKTAINDNVEIPSMKVTKKIKSIQMFKKPVDSVKQGDRAGICVTQFDPKLLERGFVCTPGSLPTIFAALVSIHKIPHFKGPLTTKSKFHITMAHETVMGSATFFSISSEKYNDKQKGFDFSQEYDFQEEIPSKPDESGVPKVYFALLELEKPVICSQSSIFIGSKLDSDIDANICRLAFHGQLIEPFTESNYLTTTMPKVKVFKVKKREGLVERCPDQNSIIAKDLFKKETDINIFAGLHVDLSSGERGTIEGSFGKSGKVKIRIPDGLNDEVYERLGGKKKNKEPKDENTAPVRVTLTFKKYLYDQEKSIKQ